MYLECENKFEKNEIYKMRSECTYFFLLLLGDVFAFHSAKILINVEIRHIKVHNFKFIGKLSLEFGNLSINP